MVIIRTKQGLSGVRTRDGIFSGVFAKGYQLSCLAVERTAIEMQAFVGAPEARRKHPILTFGIAFLRGWQ